jgi:hypothetical protein
MNRMKKRKLYYYIYMYKTPRNYEIYKNEILE